MSERDVEQEDIEAGPKAEQKQEEIQEDKDVVKDLEKVQTEVMDKRASWGNKLEFFFAMLGSCVGLGNVWRFPYLAYKNGGGAFLIPYVIMVVLIGLPLFVLELTIGQFSSSGAIKAWRLSPIFIGLGIGSIILAGFISLYYHVLIAQFLYYLFLSMSDPLPWAGCCTWWGASSCCRQCLPGDPDCVIVDCERPETLSNCTKYNLPSEEFYSTYVLKLSSGIEDFGAPVWQLTLCLLATWIIVALVLMFGAKSFGKVAYFTALFPYLMLTVMLIRGATLPGAGEGVLYYLIPKWERLLDPAVWNDAAGQAFFSISAGMGTLTSLGSYNSFNHPIIRDGILIVILDVLTSIFSGFVVFTVLGYMAIEKNSTVADVVTAGPGLVFETYPAALASMPVSPLWSILFFLMMLTLGFGSSLSLAETVLISTQDVLVSLLKNNKWRTAAYRALVCALFFLLGFPMTFEGGTYLLTIIDHATAKFGLLSIGFAECLVISWVYGLKRFTADLKQMTGWKANWFFIACWAVVSPLIIVFLLTMSFVYFEALSYGSYTFPDWAVALDVVLMILPILAVPVWWLFDNYYRLKYWVIIRYSSKPDETWGPADPENWKAFRLDPDNVYESKTSIADKYYKAMASDKATQQSDSTQLLVLADAAHDDASVMELKPVDTNINTYTNADADADADAGGQTVQAYDASTAGKENEAFEAREVADVVQESVRSPRSNKVYPQ